MRTTAALGLAQDATKAVAASGAATTSKPISVASVLWNLYNLEDFTNDAKSSYSALESTFKNWDSFIDKLTMTIEWIGTELGKGSEEEKDLKTNWDTFKKNAEATRKAYIILKDSKNGVIANHREQYIAEAIGGFIKTIPPLLSSLNSTGLSTKLHSMLPEPSELANKVMQLITQYFHQLVPADLTKKIKALHSSEARDPEKFKKLLPEEQDFLLLLAAPLNDMLKDLFLTLDEIGIDLGVKEGYLSGRPLLEIDGEIYSLRTYTEEFTQTYTACLQITEYKLDEKEETYPYTNAIKAQRDEMLVKVTAQLSTTFQPMQNKTTEIKKRRQDLVAAEIKRISDKTFSLKNELPILRELHTKVKEDDVTTALAQIKDSKKLQDGDAETKTMLRNLSAADEELETFRKQTIIPLTIRRDRITNRLSGKSQSLDLKDFKDVEPLIKIDTAKPADVKEDDKKSDEKKPSEPKTLADVAQHLIAKKIPAVRKKLTELKKTVLNPIDQKEHNDNTTIEQKFNAIEEKLKSCLDENVFQTLFELTPNAADLKDEKEPTWIEHLGHSFRSIKKSLKTYRDHKESKRAKNPALNIIKTSDELEEIFNALDQLIRSSYHFMSDPFIQQFTSPETATAYFTNASAPLMEHKKELEVPEEIGSELQPILEKMKGFCEENKDILGREAYEATQIAFSNIIAIDTAKKKAHPDALERLNKFDHFWFALRNAGTISSLISHVSLAAAAFLTVARTTGLEKVQKFNLFLRDLYLVLDKIEMQFYLKEGYLSQLKLAGDEKEHGKSLHDVVTKFHRLINEKGFAFVPDEQFPYTATIQAQRKRMLESATKPVDKTFIKSRCKAEMAEEKLGEAKKEEKENPKQEILDEIDLRVDSLKQRREESFYIWSASRRTKIEDGICALTHFRSIIAKPGYKFLDAKKELEVTHTKSHDFLVAEENEFMHKIENLDSPIADEDRGKMLIGVKPRPPVVDDEENDLDAKDVPDNFLTHTIETRIDELKNCWFLCLRNTRSTKIRLLNELKDNLATMSLDQALWKVKEKPENQADFYLLFEGKTGKVMKDIQYSQMSKEEMIRRIELEVLRLNELITHRVCFFAQNYENELRRRVEALTHLADRIITEKNESIEESLAHLEEKDDITILNKYEKKLLDDLRLWESKKEEARSFRPNP